MRKAAPNLTRDCAGAYSILSTWRKFLVPFKLIQTKATLEKALDALKSLETGWDRLEKQARAVMNHKKLTYDDTETLWAILEFYKCDNIAKTPPIIEEIAWRLL